MVLTCCTSPCLQSAAARSSPASTSGRFHEQWDPACSRHLVARTPKRKRTVAVTAGVQSPADLDALEAHHRPQHIDHSPSLPQIQSRAFTSQPNDRDWDEPAQGFNSIAEALEDLRAGKFVVVLDDEGRENEGDLIMAADKVTPEAMHFMIEHTSGYVCIAMEGRHVLA
jgi:3,4-dihydroxy-2-butanone 4-phosphate synthase